MLFYREVVLAFDFSYYRKVRPKIVLLQEIRTVEHKA
jgi:hypothetical protein